MRVLIICDLPLDLAHIKGGVESATTNLLKGFEEMGNDVIIQVLSFNSIENDFVYEFTSNCRIYYSRECKLNNYFPLSLANKWKVLRQQVELFKPDIIHYQGSGPFVLMLLGQDKSRVIISIHGILKKELLFQKSILRTLAFFLKTLVDVLFTRTFSNFIFVSNYTKNDFIGRRKKNTRVIYNCMDLSFVNSKILEFNNNIVYVGVLSKLKNVELVLEAIKNCRAKSLKMHFNVFGDSKVIKHKKNLERYTKENGLDHQVNFNGWINQRHLPESLERNMIFVLPSFQENLPISLIEAMANGRIVIASKVGGISEVVEDGINGFLIDPYQVSSLSDVLFKIHKMSESELENISNKAKKFAIDNFHPRIIAFETYEFYKSIVKKS